MSRNNYSFNGDLFPPTSPERKRHRANAEKGSSRPGNARPNRTLLSKGVIYHTREEFVKGQELAQQHPDTYWMKRAPIHLINKRNTLELYKTLNVADVKVNNETGWGYGGHVCGLCISQDGELLAGASIVGSCFIWDSMEWNVIQMLRDPNEPEIEELYRVLFSSDSRSVFTCGKLKSRSTWSEEDGDNFCIPGKIKIYDILSGKVLLQLEGHQEEILCMKIVSFKNSEYLLTGGQDGRIIKWTLTDDYSSYSKVYMDDMTTHYVCSLNILPNCGSKYFVAGCDEGIKVFDFETHVLVDSFPDLYSSYCDVVKVVLVPLIPTEPHETLLVTRGVELIDKTTGKQTRTNKCHLWKLCGPTQATPNFILEPIRIFEHADYHANTWLMNIAVTTRYLLAPTTTGKIFVWNLFSGQLVSIIATHSNCVRDIVFHPTRKQLITCGDDNVVQIFQQNTSESDEEEEEEEEEEDEELSESSSENEMEVETNNDNKLSPHILNIPSSISFAKQSKDTSKGSNINLDSPANGSQPGESAELSSSGESDSEGGESDSSSERYD